MYDEPIYELTEENISEKLTPGRRQFSPKDSSVDERLTSTLLSHHIGNKGRKLLVITIEVGNGMQEPLTVYETDNPQDVAEKFINKHNYERELRDLLKYQIESTIYEAKSKMLKKEKSSYYDTDLEIPLEVTYSENGVKFTPRHEISSIKKETY